MGVWALRKALSVAYGPRSSLSLVYLSLGLQQPLGLARSSDLSLRGRRAERSNGLGRPREFALRYTIWCNSVLDQLTDVLTALSHPSRRDIIRRLAVAPARFTDVARPLDVSLNAVTKHLKLLARAGLIEREKRGREVFISIKPEPLQLVSSWIHEYERFWTHRLDRLEQHFKNERMRKKKKR